MDMDTLKGHARGISLGLYVADHGDFRKNIAKSAGWGCGILHFNVMDGVFVPQMTGGPGFVKALDSVLLRDVHLMIENPADHVASYVAAGADIITVHAEAKDAEKALLAIGDAADKAERPVMAGLGLMPGTSIESIAPLLELAPDMILVLSLDPRTKSPPDITKACTRLSRLRSLCNSFNPVLAFDGGVTLETIDEIADCTPDMIVSGSAVLGAANPDAAFKAMTARL
jgi:ribulose-phosphate 3-epimerase